MMMSLFVSRRVFHDVEGMEGSGHVNMGVM